MSGATRAAVAKVEFLSVDTDRLGIDERLFGSCSDLFKSGVLRLQRMLAFDETKLRQELNHLQSSEEKSSFFIKIEHLERRLTVRYEAFDAPAIYVLDKVNSRIAEEFREATNKDAFWEGMFPYFFEEPYLFWFFNELGIRNNENILDLFEDVIIRRQNLEGYIETGYDHTGALRALVALRPESEALVRGIEFWLSNWNDTDEPEPLAMGILALADLDYERYESEVDKQLELLKQLQNADGSWGSRRYDDIASTSYALWAIARAKGTDDLAAKRGFQWLIGRDEKKWERNADDLLLGLLAMGDGPKIPQEIAEARLSRLEQKIRARRPFFVHTSPPVPEFTSRKGDS